MSATAAFAQSAAEVPLHETAVVNGSNVMCTGVGFEERHEASITAFPLRVEITGMDGQYLGDHTVEISGPNASGAIAVFCSGPWVLFDVPDGEYSVTSTVLGGPSKTTTANVSGAEQQRVVINFPELGGEVSPQQQDSVSSD